MMHAVQLIAAALRNQGGAVNRFGRLVELPEKRKMEICCITGERVECVPRIESIGPSFTSQGGLPAPNSAWIGVDAYTALKHGKEALGSWWCDGERFVLLDHAAAREMLFTDPPTGQWCGYVTTSYKKHGALVAPVNAHGSVRWAFETDVVDCSDRECMAEWFERMQDFIVAGVPRAAVQGGAYDNLAGGDPVVWLEFHRWACDKQSSGLYRMMSYLLPGKGVIIDEMAIR